MSQQVVQPAPKGTEQSTPSVPAYAWTILVVAYIAGVAAPLNQFKVSPVMPVLMETFNISISTAGWLMSVFAVTGFLLAIPAGIILQKLGLKTTGLLAMGFLVVGSVLGAISSSAGLMMFSRVIEGVGMGLIAVVAPAAIAMWFPREKQGTPMGIWATWVPVGSIIMFILAPAMASAMGGNRCGGSEQPLHSWHLSWSGCSCACLPIWQRQRVPAARPVNPRI
jgi:MFS family permease